MKNLVCVLLLLVAPAVLSAAGSYDKITTLTGKEYYKVKVTKVDESNLVILHKKGVTQIPFDDLPPEIREEYGYDKNQSQDAKRQIEQARSIRNARMQEEQLREEQQRRERAGGGGTVVSTNQYTPEFKAYLNKQIASGGGRVVSGSDSHSGAVYSKGPYKGMTKTELEEKAKRQYTSTYGKPVYVQYKVSGKTSSDGNRVNEIRLIQEEIESIDRQLESGVKGTGEVKSMHGHHIGTLEIQMSESERSTLENRRTRLSVQLQQLVQ